MDLEVINKLYLELSQIATAKSKYQIELEQRKAELDEAYKRMNDLEDLLRSARTICERQGAETHWKRFDDRIASFGIGNITAKVFKTLPSDLE